MIHVLVEMLMITLILACVFTGVIFIISQRQGQTFIASFDKAIVWGSGLFVIGGLLSTIAYAV
jgi:steroid 5-alpha reductase family enzyme